MKISSLLKDQTLVSQLRGIGDIEEIQVSTRSDSKLGKLLSPDWKIPFVHPVFGYFATIQAYWTWLITTQKDNSLRTMYSGNLGRYQHEHGFNKLENIQALIAEALLFRLLVSPSLVNLLKKQEKARFTSWYMRPTGQKQYTHYNVWYSNMLRDLHDAVRFDSEFSPVKYGNNISNMEEAYAEVFSYMTEDEIQAIAMTDETANTEETHFWEEEMAEHDAISAQKANSYVVDSGEELSEEKLAERDAISAQKANNYVVVAGEELSEEELAARDDLCARLVNHLETEEKANSNS